MSTVVMQQRPPTPPSNELQYRLHHIVRHNAGVPLEQDWKPEDDYDQTIQPASSFAPSRLMHQSSDPFINESYGDGQRPDEVQSGIVGLGVRYPGYLGQAGYLSPEDNGYVGSPYVGSLNDVPMTPQSDTSFGPRTRSGRSATRSDSPSVLGSQSNARITKPRVKKSRSNKAVNSKTPKLDAPLSELTKNMEIPVRDMAKWVNRSDEERQQEAVKRNGYITRPMNSFMLYRSAYAERTKQWCTQNNHQVVSSVSGESWPMEPEKVREKYNELARIERENHARAHPSYKFSPSKTPTASKKKKSRYGSDEDDEEGATDSGDPDWEWRPRNDRSIRSKPKRLGREAGYPANSSTVNQIFENQPHGFDQGMNEYPWDAGHRSVPYGMEQLDQYDHFYPMQTHLGPVNQPYIQSSMHEGMPTAIPGLSQNNFIHHSEEFNAGGTAHQMDPTLLSFYEAFDQQGSSVGQQLGPEQGEMGHEFGEAEDLFGQSIENWSSSA